MEATKKIAEFISNTGSQTIPKEAFEMAKMAILDCTGVILAGCATDIGSIVKKYVGDVSAKGTCTLLGCNMKSSADNTAWANGIMGHALDFDDINIHMIGHPTVVILPAIYALNELIESSGEEFLCSYVIGLEVAAKIGNAGATKHYKNGWHATSTLGSLGACAACAKLLKLSKEKTRMALGIAASMSSGIRANFGTMTKPFHAGHASKNGLTAALLAAQSFTANDSILETEFGFFNTFFGKESFDISKTLDHIGDPYEILSPGLIFKPYPCCGETHQGIDATLSLREQYDIDIGNVQSIKCILSEMVANMLHYHKPKTALEGKFSQEYCTAVALRDGRVGLDHFTDDKVKEPSIEELINKTSVEYKDFTEEVGEHIFPAEITVSLKSGEIYQCRVDHSKGSPENPMSKDQFREKYRQCAKFALSEKNVNRSMEILESLENCASLSELMEALS